MDKATRGDKVLLFMNIGLFVIIVAVAVCLGLSIYAGSFRKERITYDYNSSMKPAIAQGNITFARSYANILDSVYSDESFAFSGLAYQKALYDYNVKVNKEDVMIFKGFNNGYKDWKNSADVFADKQLVTFVNIDGNVKDVLPEEYQIFGDRQDIQLTTLGLFEMDIVPADGIIGKIGNKTVYSGNIFVNDNYIKIALKDGYNLYLYDVDEVEVEDLKYLTAGYDVKKNVWLFLPLINIKSFQVPTDLFDRLKLSDNVISDEKYTEAGSMVSLKMNESDTEIDVSKISTEGIELDKYGYTITDSVNRILAQGQVVSELQTEE